MVDLLMPILAHEDENSLRDLVKNVRHFCPEAHLVLYNSGSDSGLGAHLGLETFPSARRLIYAKVTPFFLDLFEWSVSEGRSFDYLINLETDMLFIRKGFAGFLAEVMEESDYMAPWFRRHTAKRSRWRPIRSLRPELRDWYRLVGFEHTHRGFSPGQVFSRPYIEKLVSHPAYPEIRRLVGQNRSYSLQEVLFPTLVDFLGMRGRSYPAELDPVNRYRPYQAVSGVRRALALPDAYFIHPVRRTPEDPSRAYIRALTLRCPGTLATRITGPERGRRREE
jgi:hypothetical protein